MFDQVHESSLSFISWLRNKMAYELSRLCLLCIYVFFNYIFYEFLLWYYLCYVRDGKYQVCAHIQEYDYVASVRCQGQAKTNRILLWLISSKFNRI